MDVAALQSFLPGGIAPPVRILWSSGKTAIAILQHILQRKTRSRVPRLIRSKHPREKAAEFRHQWSVVSDQRKLFTGH